jgi:hypothetical protein
MSRKLTLMINSRPFSLFLGTAASVALTFSVAACNKSQTPDTTAQTQPAQPDQSQQDPAAAANLAPVSDTQTAAAAAPATSAPPTQGSAPPQRNYDRDHPDRDNYGHDRNDSDDDSYNDDDDDSTYGQPVLQASAAPPPLPEYAQPDCPGDGYLWTPGYWSYSPQGSYWVPGAWARPPESGYLWTPG